MKNKGFTLLEIIIVLGIISIMLLIGASVYSSVQKRSRDAKRKADLNNIRSALELYRSNYFYYPSVSDFDSNNSEFKTKYLQSVPSDPKSSQKYSYTTKTGCDNAIVLCNDYTLYTKLENKPTPICSIVQTCGSASCNYCLGPYGEK